MGITVNILSLPIADLFLITAHSNFDNRGAFSRFYCDRELEKIIAPRKIIQINHSITKEAGSIRGLHFQNPPYAEMKLIRCLKGRIWDVAVDVRKNSTTFLQWHAEELSATNMHMIIIPEGFAHGFQVMEPNSELLYLHTAYYNPNAEGGIRYDDPLLNISWPINISNISKKDVQYPYIDSNFIGIDL